MVWSKYFEYLIVKTLYKLKVLVMTKKLFIGAVYAVAAITVFYFAGSLSSRLSTTFCILLAILFLLLAIMVWSTWKYEAQDYSKVSFDTLSDDIAVAIWNDIIAYGKPEDISACLADPIGALRDAVNSGPIKRFHELTDKKELNKFSTETLIEIFNLNKAGELIGVYTKDMFAPILRKDVGNYRRFSRIIDSFIQTKRDTMNPAEFYLFWYKYIKELKCKMK